MRLDAVGDLARHAEHPLVHRGEIDRDPWMLDRSRIEERAHQRERVEVALEREPMRLLERAPDVSKSRDVFFDPRRWPVVGHREPALDMRPHLRPEAQVESPAARLL